MTTLLLARHGNTFDSDQTPYVVGRGEDLPLVAEGEAQAQRLAEFLRHENLVPGKVLCGDLKRTRQTAEIVALELGLRTPASDSRLTEIDYGDWSGLSMDDIRRRYGNAEIEAWDRNAIMPEDRNWRPSADVIRHDLIELATELRAFGPKVVLAITSSGILRYAPGLADGAFEKPRSGLTLKVATGSVCRFDWEDREWKMIFWNLKPPEIGIST